MTSEHAIRRYRNWYANLLRLYPKRYRDRFGEGMVQTFNDLCRERAEAGQGVFPGALSMFVEAAAGAMRENMNSIMTRNRTSVGIVLATGLLLLVPLVAMQFSGEVDWDAFDFAFAFILIAGTGLLFEFAVKKMRDSAYRGGAGLALAATFMLIWANGAVGIIGDEDNAANLMYFGVIGVGVIGAIIARFRAAGMARAMFATALTQVVVVVIALIAGEQNAPHSSVFEIMAINAVFIAMWIGSALLFQRAAATGSNRNRLNE